MGMFAGGCPLVAGWQARLPLPEAFRAGVEAGGFTSL